MGLLVQTVLNVWTSCWGLGEQAAGLHCSSRKRRGTSLAQTLLPLVLDAIFDTLHSDFHISCAMQPSSLTEPFFRKNNHPFLLYCLHTFLHLNHCSVHYVLKSSCSHKSSHCNQLDFLCPLNCKFLGTEFSLPCSMCSHSHLYKEVAKYYHIWLAACI